MAVPLLQDGAQFSTPQTVTSSAGVFVQYGFRAKWLFMKASSSNSGNVYIDFTRGDLLNATTSASFGLLPGATVGPFQCPDLRGGWSGFSGISSSAPAIIFPLCLG